MKRSVIYSLMAALLLAVVAIFFFYPDDVQGRVLQQSDMQQGLANGHEGQLWKEQTGEQPRWTNALFSGMPTYQISPSYSSDKALGWVGKLYTLCLPAPANLLFGMMLGFFIMCLCMGFRWTDSLFGAIAWGLSTYFIIIIGAGHIWKFMVLMYIPPTLGGIALLYRGKYLGGLALASLFGSLQLMSNHPQMSYYFMLVILCMVLAWLWKAVKEHKTARWGLATACMVLAGLVAVGVNSPSLYNSYTYAKQTIRGNATELPPEKGREVTTNGNGGLDLDYMTHWSYGKSETFSLLIPNVKGGASVKPADGLLAPATLGETEKAEEIYNSGALSPEEYQILGQSFGQYFGDQPMTNGPVYVGAFVLVLAVLAMFVVKGPMKWALFVASILAVMLSWGSNMMWLTEWFANNIPGYNRFRTVSSILVIVEFCIPLLAVLCLVQMSKKDGPEHFRRNKWLYFSVMGLGLLVCLLGWMSPSIFGGALSAPEQEALAQQGILTNPQYANLLRAVTDIRYDMVSADSMRSFWFIAFGCLFVLLYLYQAGPFKHPKIMVLCVAALTLIDLFAVNRRYVNTESFNEPLEAQQFVATPADQAILKDTSYYRVLDWSDFQGPRSSYFHKTIGGYHAAKLTRYNDLLTHQIARQQGPNMAVIDMLNGKYFILPEGKYEQNPGAMGNAWFVDRVNYVDGAQAEMNGLDSLDVATTAVADKRFGKVLGNSQSRTPGDTIALAYYSPDKLSYNASSARGGVAVFSEVYFPDGWQATIDGKPAEIGRVNYVLRALNVPAGKHHIEFVFAPEAVETTNAFSIASVVLVYLFCAGAVALVVFGILRRRKTQSGRPASPAPDDKNGK